VILGAGICGPAAASETSDNSAVFEASQSVHFWWTELTFFDDSPKAWDRIVTPELAVSVRASSGNFEASLEVGALSDRFEHFGAFDADSLRALAQFGWNSKNWSVVLEWEGFDVFEPGIGDFYVGFNTYDLFVAKRFTASVIEGLPLGLFEASLTAGYVASTFNPLDKRFASFELAWVQPIGGKMTLKVAPKIEFGDFLHFSTRTRRDVTAQLRISPAYNLSDGVTLSLEAKGSFAFSTLETKTGETWTLTPTLTFQTPL